MTLDAGSPALRPHREKPGADIWVFAYGSLMWRPGFSFAERVRATLHGYHRSLCIYSHVHRGTPAQPGLVLGLDRGGMCKGVAYRVSIDDVAATIAYLRERELANAVYLERYAPVRLEDGRSLPALVYVADRGHAQYAGRLPQAELLRLVRQGIGSSGANPDYVRRTHALLAEMGVRDTVLEWLDRHLEAEPPPG